MRARIFAVPLLIGAGFLIGLFATETAQAQRGGKGGGGGARGGGGQAHRAAPRSAHPAPAASRPSPRPSAPTMSRPQAQPRPQAAAARPARQSAGSMGQRPAMGHQTPISRPTTPRPVNPAARPAFRRHRPLRGRAPCPGSAVAAPGRLHGRACPTWTAPVGTPISDRRFARSDRISGARQQAPQPADYPTRDRREAGHQSPGCGGRRRPVAE